MKPELIISFISELIALAQFFCVFLYVTKKLKLHGLIIWLAITINSIFVAIAQIVISVRINIPIALPIIGLIGTLILAISLSYIIYRIQKTNAKNSKKIK